MAINSLVSFNVYIHSSHLLIHSFYFYFYKVLSYLWYHDHCCLVIRYMKLLCSFCGKRALAVEIFDFNYILFFFSFRFQRVLDYRIQKSL